MANDLLDAALFYRRRGWAVVPSSPVSKKAMVKWEPYQHELPSEAQIREWWRRYPNAGVAIVTGKASNLAVLDVDPRHGGDPNAVYRQHLTPLVVRTGGGGAHFYFERPAGVDYLPNIVGRTDGKPNGKDLRADGGYVIAPPTLHPSGQRYEWLETGKKPKTLPQFILDDLHPMTTDLNGKPGPKEPWLADALQGVDHGARDDTATRLAGYYFAKLLPKDVVLEQLRLWNDRNKPPLDDEDLVKVVNSVERTRARRPAVTLQARELADKRTDPLQLLSLHQYMAQYGALDVEWAIEGWLPDKTIAMIVSPPGTYKTWMLLDLALSFASGTPFLGMAQVKRSGPVLVFQQEDFHGQMAQRLGVIMAARFDMGWHGDVTDAGDITFTPPPSPPVYFHPNRELRFDDPKIMDVLENRIRELQPVAVIMDPLYTFAPMDDYMAKAVPYMMHLKLLRDAYGCNFIIAHHTSKRKQETDREDLWGSQYLNAFLETGWQVRPKGVGSALIRRHFKAYKDLEENVLTFDIQTDKYPSVYKTTIADVKKLSVEDPKDAIIDVIAEHGPQGATELSKMLGVSRSTIHRHAVDLLKDKKLTLAVDNTYRIPEAFNV